MTREEAIRELKIFNGTTRIRLPANFWEALNTAIKALEQESCEDAISRQAVKELYYKDGYIDFHKIHDLPPVTPQQKIGHCKDCKWQKDSDGVFRRGIGAESKCPMNRIEVYEGNGYCYMFKPHESEE